MKCRNNFRPGILSNISVASVAWSLFAGGAATAIVIYLYYFLYWNDIQSRIPLLLYWPSAAAFIFVSRSKLQRVCLPAIIYLAFWTGATLVILPWNCWTTHNGIDTGELVLVVRAAAGLDSLSRDYSRLNAVAIMLAPMMLLGLTAALCLLRRGIIDVLGCGTHTAENAGTAIETDAPLATANGDTMINVKEAVNEV